MEPYGKVMIKFGFWGPKRDHTAKVIWHWKQMIKQAPIPTGEYFNIIYAAEPVFWPNLQSITLNPKSLRQNELRQSAEEW